MQATSVEKFAIVGHFELLQCETIQKVEKLKRFSDVSPTPTGTKIFEISPKMRCFGGKRWEKL